jgi:glyoxylase I family protein
MEVCENEKDYGYKISGIFIPVTNMERSVEWYVRVFGLDIIQQSDMCTGLAFPGEASIIGLWKVDTYVNKPD